MLVGALLLGHALQAASAVSIRCGSVVDAQTAPLRSPAGFTAVLKIHTADDFMKNSHRCEADFTVAVTRPDGRTNPPDNRMGSDAEWDRPIVARIEGFDASGNLAYILITEGEKDPSIYAVEYDLRTADYRDVYPSTNFARSISPQCRPTLRIAGTAPNGRMVLATSLAQGCSQQSMWELRYEQRAGKRGGTVSLDPVRLQPGADVSPLAAGTSLQR